MSTGLHEAFADLASTVEETDLAARVHAGVRRRRQRRVAGTAVATGLLAVAAFAVVARPDGKASGITTVPTVSPTPVPVVVAEPLYDVVWHGPTGKKWGLYGLRPDGTREIAATDCSLCASGDVSPDGSRWAGVDAAGLRVVSLRDGTGRTIPVDTLSEEGFVPEVTWAPDGKVVAVVDFQSYDGLTGGTGGFLLVDTETGEVTRVAYAHRNFGLAWSPDGARIAVVSMGGAVDLVTRSGTRVQRLELPSYARLPRHAFSPDGTRLLVHLDDTTAVVPIATGEVTGRLPTAREYVWRDASHVACECGEGVVTEHALDGTTTRTLIRLSGDDAGHVILRPAS